MFIFEQQEDLQTHLETQNKTTPSNLPGGNCGWEPVARVLWSHREQRLPVGLRNKQGQSRSRGAEKATATGSCL